VRGFTQYWNGPEKRRKKRASQRSPLGDENANEPSLPIYLEHRTNLSLLHSLPADSVDWSLLCPAVMTPESDSISVPTQSASAKLIANANTPPAWRDSWIKHVPLVGRTIVCVMNAMRYETTLEQNAEFVAGDLETRESRFSGCTVGVVDPGKVS
jgi:hypothetical protein